MTQAANILDKFKTRKITQWDLARKLGCGQTTIAGWRKRGVIPVRQQAQVLAAARDLGIELKPEDFFVTADAANEQHAGVAA